MCLDPLFRRLQPQLLIWFRSRTDAASAEDLAQQVWLRCCLVAQREPVGAGLVFRAAAWVLANHRRHWQRRDARTALFCERGPLVAWEPAISDLDPCMLDGLDERERTALLFSLAGYTIAEVAEQMGLTFKQARTAIESARAAIREELQ